MAVAYAADSIVNGRSVYGVRKRMGMKLAREHAVEADVIVPVPDSGVPAALGYARGYSILDREDAKDLLQACVDESGIDVKETRFPKPDVLGDIFSMALNTGRSIAETLAQDYDHFAPLVGKIEDIAARYRARKQATNGMDFDDLLTQWLAVLRDFPR